MHWFCIVERPTLHRLCYAKLEAVRPRSAASLSSSIPPWRRQLIISVRCVSLGLQRNSTAILSGSSAKRMRKHLAVTKMQLIRTKLMFLLSYSDSNSACWLPLEIHQNCQAIQAATYSPAPCNSSPVVESMLRLSGAPTTVLCRCGTSPRGFPTVALSYLGMKLARQMLSLRGWWDFKSTKVRTWVSVPCPHVLNADSVIACVAAVVRYKI